MEKLRFAVSTMALAQAMGSSATAAHDRRCAHRAIFRRPLDLASGGR
jgi:hypothetical protein